MSEPLSRYEQGEQQAVRVEELERESLRVYVERQWPWSKRTFGDGKRTMGIVQHITKELAEIREHPEDLSEWIDVVILALDGYWRHGGKPEDLMATLQTKQDNNFAREWPTPTSEDVAIEHVGGTAHRIAELEQARDAAESKFAAHIRLHDEEVARLVEERDGLARKLKGVTLCDCVTLNFCGPIKPKMLRRLCEHDLFADAACACGGTGVRVPKEEARCR